jgi:hypothetical protein
LALAGSGLVAANMIPRSRPAGRAFASPLPAPVDTGSPSPSTGGVLAHDTGINVEPSMRPTRYGGANPDGWWCPPGACNGVGSGTAFVDSEMPLAERLGVSTVRVEFPWALIQPGGPGSFDWTRADYIVRSAVAHHLEVQAIVVFTPAWDAPTLSSPPSPTDLSSFLVALVGRYKVSVHRWELWNEPNQYGYWSGTEQQYVDDVLVPGYQAIHRADPLAQVLIGGPLWPDSKWLEAIYQLGGGDSFDIMAFHDYSNGPQVNRDARQISDVLSAHGQGRKPIWLGEYGVQENSQDDGAQRALMASVILGASPVTMAEWYNLRDDFSMGCCPPKADKAGYWGLVQHDDATFKAGFASMSSLISSG